MHQKQPPAKTAVFIVAGDGLCASLRSTINTPKAAIRPGSMFFILSILDRRAAGSFQVFGLASATRCCHKRNPLKPQEVLMVKTAAIIFGIVFLAVGILGFVPAAITTVDGMPMLL